jgi:hypothetical protein
MKELFVIVALIVCIVAITLAIRIYRETPKINRKMEDD